MSNRVKLLASHADAEVPQREAPAEGRIVVCGSCFLDYIAYVDRLPNPGETLHCSTFAKGFGGKGANQAVAAARLGGKVAMAACVGGDFDGSSYIQQLEHEGVDTRGIKSVTGESTGLAMIAVDGDGRNVITICPNAASKSSAETLLRPDTFTGAKALLCQNEIPLPVTLAALKTAKDAGVFTIFNTAPAPARDELPLILPYLKYVDLLCPNEHEASLLTGVKVTDFDSASHAAAKLHDMGAGDIVVTLGAAGAAVFPRNEPAKMVPGIKIRAVDSTGAGDCFVGALARFHVAGDDLKTACEKANFCAARSVQRRGTQTSFPRRGDVPKEFFSPRMQ